MATFTFKKIADTSGSFDSFSQFYLPAINDKGVVAFQASLDDGNGGIFTGSGGPTTTIVDDSSSIQLSNNFSFNNEGTVAFQGFQGGAEGNYGIFTGSGGSISTIVTSSPSGLLFSVVSLNNEGTVGFVNSNVGSGVFAGSGGPITTIVDDSGPINPLPFGVSFNDGGTAAFQGFLDDGVTGIFTSSDGPITTIVNDSGPFGGFLGFGEPGINPVINNEGTVAFGAALDDGGGGIFTGNGGPIMTIADSSGDFDSLSSPSINNEGTVAFLANLDDGDEGIFTGSDPVTDKVIATSDLLFDSTVTNLDFAGEGLNNLSQIAFSATLENGNQVIAVATAVPEPGSGVGLLAAIVILGMVRYGWRRLKWFGKVS